MSELLEQRYPERREEAIKERLYEAYKRSGKTVDFIIDFIDNADDEDDFLFFYAILIRSNLAIES